MARSRKLVIETPESVAVTYPLAGLGSRGLAAILDVLMLGLIVTAEAAAVGLVLLGANRLFPNQFQTLLVWGGAVFIVIAFITYWGYFIFGEVARNGRTFGKRRMRIRVVRDDGGRAGVLDSVIRNFVRVLDLMPGTYAVGIVSSTFSARSQRLGDMAAGTVVVAEPTESALELGAGEDRAGLVGEYLERRAVMSSEARYQVGCALLALWHEEPGYWDEPTIAGRLADLAELRG